MSLKRIFSTTLFALAAIALGAQAKASDLTTKVQVPFAFSAGDHTFAAGTYQVIHSSDEASQLEIATESGKHLATINIPAQTTREYSANSETTATLCFEMQDGQQVLSEVLLPGMDAHLYAPKA